MGKQIEIENNFISHLKFVSELDARAKGAMFSELSCRCIAKSTPRSLIVSRVQCTMGKRRFNVNTSAILLPDRKSNRVKLIFFYVNAV